MTTRLATLRPSAMPHRPRRHTLVHLIAASTLPIPAAATTYDLSGVTLSVPSSTSSYTAADTLNTTSVTFTAIGSGAATLAPALNLVGGTTSFANTGPLTLAGPLSGSASFSKSASGTLTLTAPAPTFTGPASILSTGGIRLTDPLALGPANAPTPITLTGSLDVSGSLPARPVLLSGGRILNSDLTKPANADSLTFANAGSKHLTFSGVGDVIFSSPVPFPLDTLNKTGFHTVTYAVPTTFAGSMNLQAGTLRLGTANPFAGSTTLVVSPIATLDLNGFLPGNAVYATFGGVIANSNTSAPVTLATFPLGSPTFGGAGDILLTTKAAPFTKIGAGTLTLNTPNTTFSGSLTVKDGTLRTAVASALGNSPSSSFNLLGDAGASPPTIGVFDLNGLPAPAGSYNLVGGALVNDNVNSPSTLSSSVSFVRDVTTAGSIGGAGSITSNVAIPARLTKIGPGTLTLTQSQSFNATITGGTLKLGAAAAFSGSLTLSPAVTLDLAGRPATSLSVSVADGAQIVNHDTASPATLDSTFSVSFQTGATSVSLGGAGTLNVTGPLNPSLKTLAKVGPGLLTLPPSFKAERFSLRAGVLHAHSATQLAAGAAGSYAPIDFRGGTLRTGPLNTTPQPVYNFLNPWYVYADGGAIDTTADTTIGISNSGMFSSQLTTGTLTKTGAGTLRLNSGYQTGISFTIDQGRILFQPQVANLFAKGTLTLNADDALACTGNLLSPFAVAALAGTGNFSAFPISISTGGPASTYSGTYAASSFAVSGNLTATGSLNTSVSIALGTLTLGNGTPGAGSISGSITLGTSGTLAINRPDDLTLSAPISADFVNRNGTLAHLGAGTTTITLSPTAAPRLDLQAGQLRLSPSTTSPAHATSLSISPAASFDITSHDLLLTADLTFLPTLRQYLANQQLRSSDADTTHALGYLQNSPASFLVKLTLPGDANLDGMLNPDDFALLDKGYLSAGSTWQNGDFNYDGSITSADYLLLDTAYAKAHGLESVGPLLAQRESQFGADYVSHLLTSIPEPALPLLPSVLSLLTSSRSARRKKRE